MTSPEIKRLITGFLVLAVIVSTSALALSEFLTSQANTDPIPIQKTGTISNAFSKDKPANLNLSSPGSGNLTQGLAENIADKIIQENSDGPQDKNGSQSIQVPKDLNKMVSNYVDEALATQAPLPTSTPNETKIKIQEKYSFKDLQDYIDSINKIFQEFSGPDFKNLESKFNNGADLSTFTAAALFYSQIQTELYTLPVPAPFLDLHKNILSYINSLNDVFTQNADVDPFRAILVVQNNRTALEDLGALITSNFQVIQLTWPSIILKTTARNNSLIPIAYAQGVPVLDHITETETSIIHTLNADLDRLSNTSWIMQVLTEYFKNKVLKKIIDAIINWANGIGFGGGKPTYVTNWTSFLQKTFTTAAGQLLAEQSKNICAPFRLQLTDQLRLMNGVSGYDLGDLKGGAGCALEDLVSNVEDFYKDFGNGGWDAFTAAAMPNSNYYGSLFFLNQNISSVAQAKKDAAQLQALAGNGNLGTQQCLDKSTPNNGRCTDGTQPEITTPGKIISDLTSKGLGATIDQIVSTRDWQALSVQIGVMALDKIVTAGSKGLHHGNVTSATKLDAAEICANYTDPTEKQKCIDDVNGLNGSGNNGGGSQNLLLSQAQKEFKDTSSTLGYYLLASDTASSSIDMLNAIITSNCAQATQAKSELDSLTLEYGDILTKLDKTLSKLTSLASFIDSIQNPPTNSPDDFFAQKMLEFQNTFGTPGTAAQESGDAQQEAQHLQERMGSISALLSTCSKP
jgi:hypothetical protein